MPLPRVAYVSSGAARPPAASNGYDPTQAAKLTRNMRGDTSKDDMGSLLFPEQPNQVSRVPVPASNVALHGTSVDHPLRVAGDRVYLQGHGYAPTFTVTFPNGETRMIADMGVFKITAFARNVMESEGDTFLGALKSSFCGCCGCICLGTSGLLLPRLRCRRAARSGRPISGVSRDRSSLHGCP